MSRGSPVRGREAELTVLDELLAATRSGRGGVLIVQGTEGLGTSRLLAAARERALEVGLHVRQSTARPGDRLVPLGQLVAAAEDGDARLEPAHGPAPPSHDRRYRVLRGVQQRLRQLTEASPALVSLDDLQWTDSGTVASLGHLVRELQHQPLFWVLGAREADLPADLDAAFASLQAAGGRRLRLQPLEERPSQSLARDLLGVAAGPQLGRLVQQCAGNPALITSLVDGLLDAGLVHYDAGCADVLAPTVPTDVCDIARARLARLAPSALEVARAAAALGATCTFPQLAAMTEMSPGQLLGPLDDLTRAGLLADAESGIAYREDVLRQAVLQLLAAPVRRAVQRQAADVLLREGGPTTEVASRLIASADDGHRDGAAGLLQAARRLGVVDPAAAASVGEHALLLVERDDQLHGTLVGETALLLYASRQDAAAECVIAELLVDPPTPQEEADLWSRIAAADALTPEVRISAGRRALALEGLTQAQQGRLRASLLSGLSVGGYLSEATIVAEAVRADDADANGWVGDRRQADAAWRAHALALHDHTRGAHTAALARLDDAARCAAGDDEALSSAIEQTRVEALSMVAAPSAGLSVSARRSAQADAAAQAPAARLWDGLHGRQLLNAGRVTDAAGILRRHFGTSADGKVHGSADAAALTAFARASIRLGATADVAAARVRAEHASTDESPEIRRHALWLLAELEPPAGHGAPPAIPHYPAELNDPVRMIRLCGACRTPHAVDALRVAERRHAGNPSSGLAEAALLHARGLLDRDTPSLARAAAGFDDGGRPLDAAAALEDLAELLAPTSDEQEAQALDRAMSRYSLSGATADAARVRSRLGARDVRERPAADGPPGWERLTPAQRVVADLVAAGLSNREVAHQLQLSPHTVSDHLRQTFGKLDVHSRVRLIQLRHGRSV